MLTSSQTIKKKKSTCRIEDFELKISRHLGMQQTDLMHCTNPLHERDAGLASVFYLLYFDELAKWASVNSAGSKLQHNRAELSLHQAGMFEAAQGQA